MIAASAAASSRARGSHSGDAAWASSTKIALWRTSAVASAAGATAFLHYDEWLRIGSVVEEYMRSDNTSSAADENAVA